MKIEKLMQRRVHTCSPSDTLNSVAQILWERDCGCVPVVDGERRLLGLITDRDICMAAFFKAARLDQLRVTDVMSKHLTSAAPQDSLTTAAQRMCEARVRRMPVVDAEGKLVGILSLADLTRHASARAAASRVLAAVCQAARPAAESLFELELHPQRTQRGAAEPSPAKRGAGRRRSRKAGGG